MAPAASPPPPSQSQPSMTTPTPSTSVATPTATAAVSSTPKPIPSATATTGGSTGGGGGLHLPGGMGNKGKAVKASAGAGAGASGNPTRATSDEPTEPTTTTTTTGAGNPKSEHEGSTNVQDLMDAVGASGVDINAEEDSLRQHRPVASTSTAQNNSTPSTSSHLPPNPPQASLSELDQRIHAQSFIDPQLLADVVRKIAAEYALKSLEGQTIPLIALACRTRLMDVIAKSVEARDHRLGAHHLRKAPFGKTKRRRSRNDGDEEGQDEREEEEEEENDPMDGSGGRKEPVWDSVVYDEPEKALLVLEKVDREEERKRRRERVLRDEKEQEEKELREAVEASERARREEEGEGETVGDAGGATPSGGEQTTWTTSMSGMGMGGMETPKPNPLLKKKKKRELGQAALAKNLSGDVQKRLTDQIAMRSLGGRSFSWLSGAGGGGAGRSTLSTPNRPTAQSNLGTPTLGTGSTPSTGTSTLNPFPSSLNRLTTIPSLHDANRQKLDAEEAWRQGAHVVELKDALFALENQRGIGVGKGAGKLASLKARAGVVRKA